MPVLCEMAGIPTLGSDALTLSTTLDKVWAHRIVAGAGVPVPATREPRLAGGGGRRAAAGALPALREAALGGDRQGHRPQLARREPRGARDRGGARRADLPAARPGRGVPRWPGVHGDAGGAPPAARPAHAPAGTRGVDADRRPRAPAAPRAAGRLAPRDAGRARRGARGRADVARPPRVRRARVPGLRPGRLPPGRRRPPPLPRDEPAADVRAGRLVRHHRGAARARRWTTSSRRSWGRLWSASASRRRPEGLPTSGHLPVREPEWRTR